MSLTLGVFAASGPFEPDCFDAGADRLRRRGLSLIEAPGIRARAGFLAGDDAHRVKGLLRLTERSDVDAFIAARGGYGLTRILDRLPAEALLERLGDRPVVGFSDVTALHLHLLSAGGRALHGPVLTQLPHLPEEDVERLLGHLGAAGTAPPRELSASGPVLRSGRAEGPVWGGNLALVAALVGTEALRLPPKGVLLLLEDVGETTYRLDRLLTQLRAAGVLARARGVLLGEFVDCRPARPDQPTAEAVLAERLGDLGIPVLAGFPVGHGARNAPIPLGRTAVLDAAAGTLSW